MVSLVRRFTRVLRKDTLCMLHGLCSLVAVERALRENHSVKAPKNNIGPPRQGRTSPPRACQPPGVVRPLRLPTRSALSARPPSLRLVSP